jgi:hypothetical protein
MARKITSGIVGRAVLGNLATDSNRVRAVAANTNISLEPSGTGILESTKDLQINGGSSLRLADNDSSNYIALKSPATVASNITYTLPGTGINADYFLKTDASGNLSWALAAVSVTNQTADTATYFPLMSTTTSGTLTSVSTSNTKLGFVPSTGTLLSSIVTGGTGSGTSLVLRSTTNATKGQVYIDESTPSTTTTTGALRVSGGVGVAGQLTATTVVETSSIAFKENVNPIENALELVLQLTGVTYDRKDNNRFEAGLIAEDVYKIIPELVAKDEKGNPYGLQYTKFVAYLIESIKTLKKEIDELKGKM